MKIDKMLNDDAILAELGERLAQRRLVLGLTQAALATEAGVSKRTVERVEAGGSAQSASLVRLLRALDLLPGLEALVSDTGPGPMALLRHQGKRRQRASSPRSAPGPAEPWSWGPDE